MAAKRKHSVVALIPKEKHCVMHSKKNILLLLANKLTSTFGVTEDDNQASTKAKFPRSTLECEGEGHSR
jgi:hypothetical protein